MKGKIYFIVAIIVALVVVGILIFNPFDNHSSDTIPKQSNPDSLQTFRNIYDRATQYRLKNNVDSSISAYEEAARLKPEDKDALYYLGIMYRKERDFKKAKQTWEKLIRLDAQSERAFVQMGNLYFCMTHRNFFNPRQAEFYFQKANEPSKNSLVPNLRLGEIALYLEKTKEALDIFNKLSTMDQNNVEISFLNGFLYWKTGNESQALALLKRAFLSAKTGENINAANDDDRQCNLFLYYATAYITKSNQSNLVTSMPEIYKEFDKYLVLMRDQLNHE